MPVVPGIEVVRTLRAQPETRSLPILVISDVDNSRDRIAMLRAGADDHLTWPFDLEEMQLRVDRLVGVREVDPPAMHGSLTNHSPFELLQYLKQVGKSGQLLVLDSSFSGSVQLARGRPVAARADHLRGREALLAILGLKRGRFRMVADAETTKTGQQPLGLDSALLGAAWLEDEIGKLKEHLPPTGASLRLAAFGIPAFEDAVEEPPLAEVVDAFQKRPSLRIFDLLSSLPFAPQKIRLAVAWLAKRGIVKSHDADSFNVPPTTGEISSSLLLRVAAANLLTEAIGRGLDASPLPYLLVVEQGAWDTVCSIFDNVKSIWRQETWPRFERSLKAGRGGSVGLDTEAGELSLHVQPFAEGMEEKIEPMLSICGGVLLWLSEGTEAATASALIARVENSRSPIGGIIVAESEAAQEVAKTLHYGHIRWRVPSHPPRSLLGVLRYFLPPETK